MTLDWSCDNDFALVVDGLETVEWRPQGRLPGVIVANARRCLLPERRGKADEANPAGEALWRLPAEPPADRKAAPGDVLVDSRGTRWSVLEVSRTQTGCLRLLARDVAAVFGLTDRVDVERAVFVKDGAGAEQPVWRLWAPGVRARFVDFRRDVRETPFAAGKYTVQLDWRPAPEDGSLFRLRDRGGGVFRVIAFDGQSAFGTPATAVVVPEM
ncbi:MAG: hypothetical protein D6741_17485 [Planctomycetota bacterium]|nr:MAG: hypothetical protein D6741_17485 [Planctomycetota bacterium]